MLHSPSALFQREIYFGFTIFRKPVLELNWWFIDHAPRTGFQIGPVALKWHHDASACLNIGLGWRIDNQWGIWLGKFWGHDLEEERTHIKWLFLLAPNRFRGQCPGVLITRPYWKGK